MRREQPSGKRGGGEQGRGGGGCCGGGGSSAQPPHGAARRRQCPQPAGTERPQEAAERGPGGSGEEKFAGAAAWGRCARANLPAFPPTPPPLLLLLLLAASLEAPLPRRLQQRAAPRARHAHLGLSPAPPSGSTGLPHPDPHPDPGTHPQPGPGSPLTPTASKYLPVRGRFSAISSETVIHRIRLLRLFPSRRELEVSQSCPGRFRIISILRYFSPLSSDRGEGRGGWKSPSGIQPHPCRATSI